MLNAVEKPLRFVDLHLHAEGISDQDLATLAFFGLDCAVTCANDAGASSKAELLRHWDDLVQVQTQRLLAAGIKPLVALAVHPERIPWHGVDALLERLPHYFDDPRVVALGELGLHRGGEREEQLFARQLELAARLERPVIVHTPGRDKLSRTRRLLAMLKESRVPPQSVLVDHATTETLPLIRACGHWAGLTLQPDQLGLPEVAQLFSRHGAGQLVVTSDIGEGSYDLLALPRAAEALREAGLSEDLIEHALHDGPLSFLRGE